MTVRSPNRIGTGGGPGARDRYHLSLVEARSPLRRLGPAVALLALVLTACSGRGPIGASPAAQVGDRVVSIADLERHHAATREAIEIAEQDGSGQVAPGTAEQFFLGSTPKAVPADGMRSVLNELVQLEALRELADDLDVTVTDADRDAIRSQIPPEVMGDMPEDYLQVRIDLEALRAGIGEVTDVSEDDLQAIYEDQKADYTQVCIAILGVDDEDDIATAERRLRTGEDFEAVAADLDSLADAEQIDNPICQATRDLEATFGPAIYEVAEGDVLDAVRADESVWLIAQVAEVDTPEFDDIEQFLRPNAVELNLDRMFRRVTDSVYVNPRFGVWNPETLTVDAPAAPTERSAEMPGT